MRRSTFIACFLLAVFCLFLILQYFGVTTFGFKIGFETLRKGWWSGFSGMKYCVVQDAEEWAEICRKTFPPDVDPPEIDFSTATVIAVFMGQKPTAGYEIEVKEITDTIFRVVVRVAWITHIGKGVAQVFTSLFHIIKTEKINKPITFQTVWETADR